MFLSFSIAFPYIDIYETYWKGREEGKQIYYTSIYVRKEGRKTPGKLAGKLGRKGRGTGSKGGVDAGPPRYGRNDARKAAGIDAAGTMSNSNTTEGRQEGTGTGGRQEDDAGRPGRQAGRLPGPVKLREMLIIRKFEGRKSSAAGPDPAGTGAGRGDSFKIGVNRSTAIPPPAPHLPHLFHFLVFFFTFLPSHIFRWIFWPSAHTIQILPLDGLV